MIPDITGPESPSTGIIDLYDIFGPAPQTVQGADMLASALGAVVLLPDFLKGDYVLPEWLPPDTDEKMANINRIINGHGAFEPNAEVLVKVVQEAKGKFPSVGAWGAVGLCWGGKVIIYISFFFFFFFIYYSEERQVEDWLTCLGQVTAITSGPGTLFSASAQVHPG